MVSTGAALTGVGDLALGNIVGSNIANIALILGVTALISPIRVQARIIRIDLPIMLVVTPNRARCSLRTVLVQE